MNNERLLIEQNVLQRYLPHNTYKFLGVNTNEPYVLISTITNSGKLYTIRMDLVDFPSHPPHAFITQMLITKDGKAMKDEDVSMKTLPSEHGYTRIAHYGLKEWVPNISIYKVYIKCRIWLEMYELYLKSGNNMDYFLHL